MDNQKINKEGIFSIGNRDIDEEHEVILSVYNELIELIDKDIYREEFAKLLTKMTDYALAHFKKEESYMKAFNYPKFEEHKRYHKNYIYRVAKYNAYFSVSTDINSVLTFLREWWKYHIQNIDKDYENYKKMIKSDVTYGL